MPHFAEMVYHLGGVPVMAGIPFGKNANYYFVDPANGSNSNDGLSLDKAVADITTAYGLCTTNQHDTVFYIAGSSSNTLSAALTWSKSYTHLIGICAPTQIAQRARIFQLSTLTGASPLLNITGSGCIFKNFYIFQGVDDATSLINVQVTGQRNYFENVHFAGGGHNTMAIDNCASLFVNGGDENTFVNCVLGIDTIDLGNGGNVLRFDGEARRNIFRNCYLNVRIDHAGARLVEMVDGTATEMMTIFDNCIFHANSTNKATTMASAFEIPSGSSITASVILKDCTGIGFTDWDDDDRGLLYLNVGTITGGGNSGIAQASAAA